MFLCKSILRGKRVSKLQSSSLADVRNIASGSKFKSALPFAANALWHRSRFKQMFTNLGQRRMIVRMTHPITQTLWLPSSVHTYTCLFKQIAILNTKL